jgi:ribosomal protein S18 acetylase RimI-like enzyme
MTIRLMQESDHAQLVRLWQSENMETSADYLRAVLRRNPTTCFVMEIEGCIVAAACGLYDGRRGVLQSVAVLPEEQGKGYGRAIVEAVVTALQELGTSRIRLFVVKENTRALGFYEHLGFQIHDYVHYMGLA